MPNHENLVIHQAAHAASVHGVVGRVVANLLRQTNRILFGCDIGIGANIDDSVQFFHCGLGCVIHSDVVLGRGCKVFPHVVIGNSWGGGGAFRALATMCCLEPDAFFSETSSLGTALLLEQMPLLRNLFLLDAPLLDALHVSSSGRIRPVGRILSEWN